MKYKLIIFLSTLFFDVKSQVIFHQSNGNNELTIIQDTLKSNQIRIEFLKDKIQKDTIWTNGGILLVEKFQDVFFSDSLVSFLAYNQWGIDYYLIEKKADGKWKAINYERLLRYYSEYSKNPTHNKEYFFTLKTPNILEEKILYKNGDKKPIKKLYKFESGYKKTLISKEETQD